ncbi:MAG: uracil-DNA glycosylase [Bryobacteraceae bacterium]|nr:MAG: uracil-DNA glycosylase [Bryobacteraceae bacterium]
MDLQELRRWLEFYRDLGVRTIYLPMSAPADSKKLRNEPKTDISITKQNTYTSPPPASSGPSASAKPEMLAPPPAAAPQLVPLFDPGPEGDSLERILADIGDCRRCRLCEGRAHIVFGSGNPRARLVFVGEGPGEEEDLQGLPFVGRAGQLLTQMINNTAAKEGMGVRREDVYICNVVKCRPPKNRTPEPDEMEICGQFLFRQLNVIRPRAICALGSTAARALLGAKEGITKLRGRWHMWRDIPVMPTYHPSYLLRPYNQNAKREAWEDLKKVLHYVYDEPPRPLSDF